MSKMFHKVVIKEKEPEAISKQKIMIKIFSYLLFVGLGLFIVLQLSTIGFNIYKNWNAIKFAYEKPNIVNIIKSDYEVKQSKLEQSYLNSSSSAEVQWVDEVVAKLKEANLK